jgi:hypothetical protein
MRPLPAAMSAQESAQINTMKPSAATFRVKGSIIENTPYRRVRKDRDCCGNQGSCYTEDAETGTENCYLLVGRQRVRRVIGVRVVQFRVVEVHSICSETDRRSPNKFLDDLEDFNSRQILGHVS